MNIDSVDVDTLRLENLTNVTGSQLIISMKERDSNRAPRLRSFPRHHQTQHPVRQAGQHGGGGGEGGSHGGAAHLHHGVARRVRHSGGGERTEVVRR